MWLPSFLTFPLSFGSLPSVSLPANIQRRFLSYVLKRSLGRFVVASGFDVERIQAQLSQGSVELEKLEVNVEVGSVRERADITGDQLSYSRFSSIQCDSRRGGKGVGSRAISQPLV